MSSLQASKWGDGDTPYVPTVLGPEDTIGSVTARIRSLDRDRIGLICAVFTNDLWKQEYVSFPEWLEGGLGYRASAAEQIMQQIQLRIMGVPSPSPAVAKALKGLSAEEATAVMLRAADLDDEGCITSTSVNKALEAVASGVTALKTRPPIAAPSERDKLVVVARGITFLETLESALRAAISAARACRYQDAAAQLNVQQIINALEASIAGVKAATPVLCSREAPHTETCTCRGRGWITRFDIARMNEGVVTS